MKNRLFLLSMLLLFFNFSFGQFLYKNELETVDGIEIKYKVVHSKLLKKDSPVQLRLKLKNTNDYDASLTLEVEYNTGFTTKYRSGEFEICIPKNTSKRGKSGGLAFELNSNDKNIFLSDDTEWEFIKFVVEKIENCISGKNQ